MSSRHLKLNTNKTECRHLDFERLDIRDFCINEIELTASNSVQDLIKERYYTVIYLFKAKLKRVKIAGYHLGNVAFVKKYLD